MVPTTYAFTTQRKIGCW